MKRLITALALGAALTGIASLAPPAQAAGVVQLGRIQYNSPGTDTATNSSVNGEYVVIKNLSSRAVSLTGWTLRDAQSHVYKFGTYSLGAYKTVTVHTGKGANSTLVRYWGMGYHVWNNGGDTAVLKNAAGVGMDSCRWTSAGRGYLNC